MKRIGVICKDKFLFQKIKLTLLGTAECVFLSEKESANGFTLCLVDIDSVSEPLQSGIVRMSRTKECELKIPFLVKDLLNLINKDTEAKNVLTLDYDNKSASFKNSFIKLTELEFILLSTLFSERRFFSKEELLHGIWGEETDIGIVNVYIHYLREKLESGGDKVIISARNKGYKIDERFLGEEGENASFY